MSRIRIILMACLALASTAAFADEQDPPSRAARLSVADGSVSMQPAGVDDWAAATINRPMTTGDKLWTDQNSRAEVDVGSAVIRLGSTTGFSFLNLGDQATQVNVTAGTAIVHVRDLGENQNFELDTPNIAVTLLGPGDYRVEVSDAGDASIVKVSNGDAEVAINGATVPVHTQQAFTFSGTDQVDTSQASLGAPDSLDQWSLDRDRREQQAARANDYVSPDVAGAQDLNQYGSWEPTPDYGPVWTPSAVPAGWAPYQAGRWVWVSPWGWTWVDDAPWGYAPFHYGRWAYYRDRWCWVPGPRQVRPVYAPALVAWVGGHPGTDAALVVGGAAAVAWFALGPREVFVPSYRVSNNYVRNVNVTNTTIVNNTYITNVYENRVTNVTYVNRDKPGAVAAVPQNVFNSAQSLRGHIQRVPPAELARYRPQAAAPAIAPVRESVLAPRSNINVRRPPAAIANRPVVARVAPPPAPASFDRQLAAIRANGDRPVAQAQIAGAQARTATQPVRVVRPGPARVVAPQPGVPNQQSLGDRERALHASPLPNPAARPEPGLQNGSRGGMPPNQVNPPPTRSDRPPGAVQPQLQSQPQSKFQAAPDEPQRPVPQARPLPQAHPLSQARPIEPPRPTEAPRVEQPRAIEQAPPRPVEQQRPVEQPRAVEQARPVEQPRAVPVPPPAAHPAAPPPKPAEQRPPPPHPGAPKPGEPRV